MSTNHRPKHDLAYADSSMPARQLRNEVKKLGAGVIITTHSFDCLTGHAAEPVFRAVSPFACETALLRGCRANS
eukprot:1294494-Amphidinium_carterae.1